MSDPKDPFDPFATSGDRTVFRPNPGGRRAAAPPAQPAPPPASNAGWPETPQPLPAGPAPYPQPPRDWGPPPPSQDPGRPPAGAGAVDAWAERSSQMRQAPRPAEPEIQQQAPQAPVVVRRDLPKTPNENPIMAAAQPILLMLGRLRIALMQVSFASLMEQVAQAIQNFEQDVRITGNLTQDQVRTAKYLVCATADDIVQNIPDQDRQLWTQYSMLARFFNDRMGGVRFFEELEKLKADPAINYPILELQHACLALGFQGQYRMSAGGPATLQGIQRTLYETIRRVKSRAGDLSPRWQGQDLSATISRFRIPFWAVAALFAAMLVAMYITLRALLAGGADAVIEDVSRIFPATDVQIQSRSIKPVVRAPPPPAPAATSQLERIRAALKAEIDEKKLEVEGTATSIVVHIGSFASFAPGKANVIPEFVALAKKIATVMDKEPGQIRVVGHTDNTPIASGRFASNQELSVARAKAVSELLAKDLSQKDRLLVEGKGDSQPLKPNTSAENKALNRRVDVSIPHEK